MEERRSNAARSHQRPSTAVSNNSHEVSNHAVPVDQLKIADSPRLAGIDSEHVRLLAESDAELPPILVHRPTMCVIDGAHRLCAARMKGLTQVTVQFFDGSYDEAFVLAVEANVTHGLPLTLADRRAAAERILRTNPALSDRSIAATTGLAARTVAAVRQRLGDEVAPAHTRIGRDGVARPMSTADRRRVAGEMLRTQPQTSLRRIAAAAGISLATAQNVRERMRRGEDPVPDTTHRRTGRPVAAVPPTCPPGDLVVVTLQHLRRDPSLRYTESGRFFLRWLSTHTVQPSDWENHVLHIPPQSAILVARFARACSQVWSSFAEVLERDRSTA